MSVDTAWRHGRLSSSAGPRRLLFGQMYEDVEIEAEAFRGRRRVFCIASAGSTAVRLADEHEVVACDINPVQLAYAERRARGGPQESGDAERAMQIARLFMPIAGWRAEAVRVFLALADVGEQLAFWKTHLDTSRFRLGFDALMSRALLRIVYTPELLACLPPRFGSVLRARLERTFRRHPNASNPYARALLLGEPALERGSRGGNIRFVAADAAACLESSAARSFDAFTLSNILDGATPAYRTRLAHAVRRAASNNAVVVSRSFAEPAPDLDTNHAERDRSMLWGLVDIRPVHRFS